jgi:hypothetical protein
VLNNGLIFLLFSKIDAESNADKDGIITLEMELKKAIGHFLKSGYFI